MLRFIFILCNLWLVSCGKPNADQKSGAEPVRSERLACLEAQMGFLKMAPDDLTNFAAAGFQAAKFCKVELKTLAYYAHKVVEKYPNWRTE